MVEVAYDPYKVALRAGAWIETAASASPARASPPSPSVRGRGLKRVGERSARHTGRVALRAGAWIETIIEHGLDVLEWTVARAGAWIETPGPW